MSLFQAKDYCLELLYIVLHVLVLLRDVRSLYVFRVVLCTAMFMPFCLKGHLVISVCPSGGSPDLASVLGRLCCLGVPKPCVLCKNDINWIEVQTLDATLRYKKDKTRKVWIKVLDALFLGGGQHQTLNYNRIRNKKLSERGWRVVQKI